MKEKLRRKDEESLAFLRNRLSRLHIIMRHFPMFAAILTVFLYAFIYCILGNGEPIGNLYSQKWGFVMITIPVAVIVLYIFLSKLLINHQNKLTKEYQKLSLKINGKKLVELKEQLDEILDDVKEIRKYEPKIREDEFITRINDRNS